MERRAVGRRRDGRHPVVFGVARSNVGAGGFVLGLESREFGLESRQFARDLRLAPRLPRLGLGLALSPRDPGPLLRIPLSFLDDPAPDLAAARAILAHDAVSLALERRGIEIELNRGLQHALQERQCGN